MIDSHEDALQVLTTQPRCTDAAIAALERFAPARQEAWSDLAGAYYVRAQREDDPQDLLRALDAAHRATIKTPRSPAAHFNRALAEEALGLTHEAAASWARVAELDRSDWGKEAVAHRRRVAGQLSSDAAAQWRRNLQQLPSAVSSGDPRAVARLIAEFPSSAQRHIEEDVLPEWAQTGTPERLQYAKVIAAELLRITGDPYSRDVANAVAKTSDVDMLRQGLVAFRAARMAERNLRPAEAGPHYANAAELLARAGNPLHLAAALGATTGLLYDPSRYAEALERLSAITREAGRGQYVQLAGRVHSVRGLFLFYEGRYIDSVAAYSSAVSQFVRARDRQSAAKNRTRQIGIYRTIGQVELAWREAFQARRLATSIIEVQERHVLLGEAAAVTAALGYPAIALLYQNTAIRLLQSELEGSADGAAKAALRINLGIAIRSRVELELALGREDRARADLAQSMELLDEQRREGDLNVHRALSARVEELRGRTLLPAQPRQAVAAFTRALELPEPDGYRTLRASLLAQRGEAHRRAGDVQAAQADLREALRELRLEEASVLAQRTRGGNEELWSAYFARFRDTYERLVRQLVADRKTDEAFVYAERAKAFEPLDLLLRSPQIVPNEFRPFVENAQATDIARIQAALPPATFVIEYFVGADETYAWVISRERAQFTRLSVRRADVDRWSGQLQRAARERMPLRFDLALYAAFDKLVREPLSIINDWPGGRDPGRRLVFVPDQSIHGLPLAALRNPVTRRYLVEDYSIEIAGSALLYVFSLLRDRALSPETASAFLVGDPAFDRHLPIARALDRLPRAESEVRRISQLYAPSAELRIGTAATVSEFLQRARHSSVVHVAGHAIANPRAPFSSLLLFAPDASHSGALSAEELLQKARLEKTRLFVMSACSSAGGSPVGPEGLAPLVRPLIASGLPAVIGSLWDVDDAAAEALLVSFHRHYLQGNDAASALRAAQLEVIHKTNNPGLRSVLAWAQFQVVGHASSPARPAR